MTSIITQFDSADCRVGCYFTVIISLMNNQTIIFCKVLSRMFLNCKINSVEVQALLTVIHLKLGKLRIDDCLFYRVAEGLK